MPTSLLALAIVAWAGVGFAQDRSQNLGTSVEVEVHNDTGGPVEIVWIDSEGVEYPSGVMRAGDRGVISTEHGHLHVFRANGREVGRYAATGEREQAYRVGEQNRPTPPRVVLGKAGYVELDSGVSFQRSADKTWDEVFQGRAVQRYSETQRTDRLIELHAVDKQMRVQIRPSGAVSDTPMRPTQSLGSIRNVRDGDGSPRPEPAPTPAPAPTPKPHPTPNPSPGPSPGASDSQLGRLTKVVEEASEESVDYAQAVDNAATVATSGISTLETVLNLSDKLSKHANKLAVLGATVGLVNDLVQLFSDQPTDTEKILSAIDKLGPRFDALEASMTRRFDRLELVMELLSKEDRLFGPATDLGNKWDAYKLMLKYASSPNSKLYLESRESFIGGRASWTLSDVDSDIRTVLKRGVFAGKSGIFESVYKQSNGDINAVNSLGVFLFSRAIQGIQMYGALRAEEGKSSGSPILDVASSSIDGGTIFDSDLEAFMADWRKRQDMCVENALVNAEDHAREWLEKNARGYPWDPKREKAMLQKLRDDLKRTYPSHSWSCLAATEQGNIAPEGRGWVLTEKVNGVAYFVHGSLASKPYKQAGSLLIDPKRRGFVPHVKEELGPFQTIEALKTWSSLVDRLPPEFGVALMKVDRVTWASNNERPLISGGYGYLKIHEGKTLGFIIIQ